MTFQLPLVRRRVLFPTAAFAVSLMLSADAHAAGGAEWQSLSDLAAWKTYAKPADAGVKWTLEAGVLAWQKGGGNLVTRETYADFELELDWKLGASGNSGVMFWVNEADEKPWHSGPEIQLLDDDAHRDGKNPATRAGSLYALYPPSKFVAKPVGEWNALRVRVQAGRIQCWLNGVQTVDAQVGSADWKERVAKSKFAPFAQFARDQTGRILLQDHGDPVWFRSLRVRRL